MWGATRLKEERQRMPGETRSRANKSGQRNRPGARGKPPDNGAEKEKKKKRSRVVKAVVAVNEHAEKAVSYTHLTLPTIYSV